MEARELGADARGNLDKAISMSPDFGRSYIISAQCFDAEIAVLKMQARFATSMSMGQQEEYTEILSSLSTKAIAARVAAIERALSKNWRAQIFNALAWTHATTDDPDFLNGPLAVAYAKEAISLQPDQSVHLDTLAAAYARTDDFKEAVAVQKKAIALLPATQEANRPGYAERLAAYEQGQAYTAPK
jgi:tetratricopeptide (TPR) repeat protein